MRNQAELRCGNFWYKMNLPKEKQGKNKNRENRPQCETMNVARNKGQHNISIGSSAVQIHLLAHFYFVRVHPECKHT